MKQLIFLLIFLLIGCGEGPERNRSSATAPRQIIFMAVGDMMLSRGVWNQMKRHRDYKYPFLNVAPVLRKADIAFGNLECVLIEGPKPKKGTLVFRADPGSIEGLTFSGFDVLSLANNHSPNQGQTGLRSTFSLLKKHGIHYVGAGENIIEAHRPLVINTKGKRLAFLAYTESTIVPLSYKANVKRAGVAFMELSQMRRDVAFASRIADRVIVSMHAGKEYIPIKPHATQIGFARAAIDSGAHLVIGHHPHVIQRVERYNKGTIFYSLGNFIFDQRSPRSTREGLIVEIHFHHNLKMRFRFIPVVIQHYAQPKIIGGKRGKNILKRLGLENSGLIYDKKTRMYF